MFELCTAASRCLSNGAATEVVCGISLSVPCVLSKPAGTPPQNNRIITCRASYSGQLEVRTSALHGPVRQPDQVHLSARAGHFSTVRTETSRQQGLPGKCLATLRSGQLQSDQLETLSQPLEDIQHTPSLAAWLPAALEQAQGTRSESVFLQAVVSGSLVSPGPALLTNVACLLPSPLGGCGQPGGYAIHPAALDAATHTAAAFADAPGTDSKDAGKQQPLPLRWVLDEECQACLGGGCWIRMTRYFNVLASATPHHW